MAYPGNSALRRSRRLLVPYLGYGTSSEIQMMGRVMRDNHITVPKDSDPVWVNVRNMIKRYTYKGVPNTLVQARFRDLGQEVVTNRSGYFGLHFALTGPLEGQAPWFDVELRLLDQPGQPAASSARAPIPGKVLVPSNGAQFGVVSDIDDTVLRTDILHIARALSNTFFRNARTRLPFEGVAAFYNALRLGTVNGATNPIYYVSSSPWNLYDLIVDFFVIRGIPLGPLFLTELGFAHGRYHRPGTYQHKIGVIQTLFDAYPTLPFILIGDSGQKDAEVYFDLVRRNPGRIRTIYLRDVTGRRRERQIRSLMAQVSALGTEMVFSADTLAASNHALERGYILPHKVPEVAEEREKDKPPPSLVQQLLSPETSESRP